MNIGVIGAGAAGLAAAYELLKKGHSVKVYEAAPFVGGQAATFDVGNGRLERGYHHLFKSDTHMVDLIHELGLGEKLAWIESKVGFYHDGTIYNFVTPFDLLKFKPLSLINRIRLGLVTLYLQKTSNWKKFEGVTAKEWIVKWAGQQAYDVVWGPLLRGKVRGERRRRQHGLAVGQDIPEGRLPGQEHAEGEAGLPDGQLRRSVRSAHGAY